MGSQESWVIFILFNIPNSLLVEPHDLFTVTKTTSNANSGPGSVASCQSPCLSEAKATKVEQ